MNWRGMSWLIHLIITGHASWGPGSTSQAFGVPFSGELFLVLSSDSVPYRVTGGSLWDKRWLLRPIDLFILSVAARTSCASLKQTFLFYCLWKELIKNQLQEITHKQKLVFIYAGYLLKTKKIIKPQAHTMKCAYLRLPTTNMSVPWLSNERLVPHQQEKSYAWGRGGQLSPLPESPGHYSILWVSRKSLERPFSPENLVLQRARK